MPLQPPVPRNRACCLFLDIDGTLLDFAPTPDQVRIDDSLLDLLGNLDRACAGAVAFVSGRSIHDIDGLFEPLCLAAAGVHGCERRDARGRLLRPYFETAGLHELRSRLDPLVQRLDGTLVEDKRFGIAIHYRAAPHLEGPLRAGLGRLVALIPAGFQMLDGDHVIEIKPASHNKATAVDAFMHEEPFAGRLPVFIGDDLTDQDGFAAVRKFDGMAIGVGHDTGAEWQLPNPLAVRRWLESFLLREQPG
jgi:trehalose 6-phosphate phosphatase